MGSAASLQFSGNTASYRGGAVYVESGQECIFDGDCLFVVQKIYNIIQLRNNSAKIAGSILYGGNIYCIGLPSYTLYDISNAAEERSSSLSSIASNPYRVCFCVGGDVQCNINTTVAIADSSSMSQQ